MSVDAWSRLSSGPEGPTMFPVVIEPSPPGTDDRATLLAISAFNGLCRALSALADRGLLCYDELVGIEEAMTTPLDDPEWREDDVITSFRNTATDAIGRANATIAALSRSSG